MTAEQLEELQRLVDRVDNDTVDSYDGVNPYFAADLARKVIAAEKLVVAANIALDVMEWVDGENDCSSGIDAIEEALAAYREAGK